MLVGPYHSAVDKQRLEIRIIVYGIDHPLPYTFLAPAREACIRRVPVAQCRLQIAPRRARAGDKQAVVLSCRSKRSQHCLAVNP